MVQYVLCFCHGSSPGVCSDISAQIISAVGRRRLKQHCCSMELAQQQLHGLCFNYRGEINGIISTTSSMACHSLLHPLAGHIFVAFFVRLMVDARKKYWLFVFYTFFVVAVAAIQFCIFIHGTSFMKGFLHIDLDVDQYESVRWGAAFFALICYFAMPRNRYIKFAK